MVHSQLSGQSVLIILLDLLGIATILDLTAVLDYQNHPKGQSDKFVLFVYYHCCCHSSFPEADS